MIFISVNQLAVQVSSLSQKKTHQGNERQFKRRISFEEINMAGAIVSPLIG